MFLKRMIYVNWGNIPMREFTFGAVNLLSGGNGSGKTTAADGIQTLMTAAHENLFQYNPGQDETSQRGRGGKRVRTLASYILGCDDGSYARGGLCDGYLAAVFAPTEGEQGLPFSALMGVRAWLDSADKNRAARQDDLQLMLLPQVELQLADLVTQDDGDRRSILPLDQAQKTLVKAHGRTQVESFDTKKGYLRRLYALLRGREDSVSESEAVGAARAYSRFMAYKPVHSVHRFVADEVLERRDLGDAVRAISGQLKTIHAMERDANRLNASADLLDGARSNAEQFVATWFDNHALEVADALRQRDETDQLIQLGNQRAETLQTQIEQKTQTANDAALREREIHQQMIDLEAQRQGVSALREKDQLQARKNLARASLLEQVEALHQAADHYTDHCDHSRKLSTLLDQPHSHGELKHLAKAALPLLHKALAHGNLGLPERDELMQKDWLDTDGDLQAYRDWATDAQSALEHWRHFWHVADGGGRSRRDVVLGLAQQADQAAERAVREQRQCQRDIDALSHNRASYPAYVERALEAIRRECPAADPMVLCDQVDIDERTWQMAIEGYLGATRFSLLVAPDQEANAARILRQMPGRDNRARVLQTQLASNDAKRRRVESDSIVKLMRCQHPGAMAYLSASFGNVLCVADADALRQVRRGVTADGLASGGYAMYRVDLSDADLVFGADARLRALQARQEEAQQLELQILQLRAQQQHLIQILDAVNALQPISLVEPLNQLLGARRDLFRAEDLLERLDISDHTQLEERLESLRDNEQTLRAQGDHLLRERGQLEAQLEQVRADLERLRATYQVLQNSVDSAQTRLNDTLQIWPEGDHEACTQNINHYRTLGSGAQEAQKLTNSQNLRDTLKQFQRALSQHNTEGLPQYRVIYHDDEHYSDETCRRIIATWRDAGRVLSMLRHHVLVERREQIAELKTSFNHAFVSQLCHAIHQAIADGERQLAQLNEELSQHQFGSDKERYRFDAQWLPELAEYARLFQAVVKNPLVGMTDSLFDAELPSRQKAALTQLMSLLLDEDEQRALDQLTRIADYRQYKRYEIYKEVEGKPPLRLSEYGTGSGGQLETPAYIIRAAAITAALKFSEGNTHLRMVLVDEAFSKMDETRSREVIGYLTQSLGLQLVFIMPTSKCGPYMDLISHEFIFAKVPASPPRGELNTRVLVDRRVLNTERVQALWAQHRRITYDQASFDFLDDVLNG